MKSYFVTIHTRRRSSNASWPEYAGYTEAGYFEFENRGEAIEFGETSVGQRSGQLDDSSNAPDSEVIGAAVCKRGVSCDTRVCTFGLVLPVACCTEPKAGEPPFDPANYRFTGYCGCGAHSQLPLKGTLTATAETMI